MKKRLIPFFPGILALALALALALPLTGCNPTSPPGPSSILLFTGDGTSPNGVRAVEEILRAKQLPFTTADSDQLNRLSAAQLAAHRLIIIPGGNYIIMGNSLKPETAVHLREAVQGGVNYLGICAGGILAGNATQGLNLTSGVRFGFYREVNRGIHRAVVSIATAGASPIDQYWEDGPEFTGWGDVVGKYPDGTPAIVEGSSGKGRVILSGVHPEAPESWRRGLSFSTPAEASHAYAGSLVETALHGTSLPHY